MTTTRRRLADPGNEKRDSGSRVGIGAVLGVGIGAAIGAIVGDLGTGIWIGDVIGVGLGLLMMQLRR